MNILYIRTHPVIDGTFTLIIRLAENAKKDGHTPYFLFWKRNMPENILQRIKTISPYFYLDELDALKAQGKLPTIDVIHGILFGEALLKGYSTIKAKFHPNAAMVHGFYHPRTLITKTNFWPALDNYMYADLLRSVPKKNLTFMNEAVRREHENFFKIDLSESPIVPLIIHTPDKFPEPRLVNTKKIVSIGRLVPFKMYVIPVIRILAKLNEQGHSFEYHIYGDGEMMEQVKQLIEDLHASNFVFMHGTIAYDNFNKVIQDALLFIGMGTSIIESSARGVPSVLAIESRSDDATYGWYYDQKGYEVGEQIVENAVFSYEQFILQAFNSTPTEYEEMCFKSWKKSQEFSSAVVMNKYYQLLNDADRNFNYKLPAYLKWVLKIMRQPLKLKFFVKKVYQGR